MMTEDDDDSDLIEQIDVMHWNKANPGRIVEGHISMSKNGVKKFVDDDDDDKGVNGDVQADLRVYSVLSPGSPERKTGGRGFPDTTISCLEDDQHEDRLIVFVEHSLSSSSSSPLLTMARLTWLVQAGWSHDKCSCQNPPRAHSCILLVTIWHL